MTPWGYDDCTPSPCPWSLEEKLRLNSPSQPPPFGVDATSSARNTRDTHTSIALTFIVLFLTRCIFTPSVPSSKRLLGGLIAFFPLRLNFFSSLGYPDLEEIPVHPEFRFPMSRTTRIQLLSLELPPWWSSVAEHLVTRSTPAQSYVGSGQADDSIQVGSAQHLN